MLRPSPPSPLSRLRARGRSNASRPIFHLRVEREQQCKPPIFHLRVEREQQCKPPYLSLAGQGARGGGVLGMLVHRTRINGLLAPTGRKVTAQGKAKRRPGFAPSRYEM